MSRHHIITVHRIRTFDSAPKPVVVKENLERAGNGEAICGTGHSGGR
jgi:hypothetical protein